MKEFKARKIKKRKRSIIIFIFILFFFFSYVYMFLYLSKHKLKKSIINKDISYIKFDALSYIDSKIDDAINNPVIFLSFPKQKYNKVEVVNKTIKKESIEEDYKPIIYLYNTHQGEAYDDYSVYDATYKLANELHNDKYYTYFEENSIPTFLNNNKMKYKESYKASRFYLNKAHENYKSIKYYFDIHRDSISKDKVTLNYKGKNYAKILFLIGLENKNHDQNYEESQKLSNIINNHIPNLSKGIYKKEGKKVNGVYNQDFDPNTILVELGGEENTIEEAVNTIEILSKVLSKYIGGRNA